MTNPTPAQDNALWTRYLSTRDPGLREELILRYVPLVRYVLNRLSLEPGPEFEDLSSQGLLGLIEAVDRYDPARGTSFSTYATHRIRGHILDSLRALDVLSRSARRRVRLLESAISDLSLRLGRTPEDQELAGHLGLGLDDLQQSMQDASRVMLSLDTPEGDSDPYDYVASDAPDMLENLAENDTKAEVVAALAALPERDQLILSLYYRNGLTMKEIGSVLNISESRVCQLHGRILLNLRSQLSGDRLSRQEGVAS